MNTDGTQIDIKDGESLPLAPARKRSYATPSSGDPPQRPGKSQNFLAFTLQHK